MKRVMAFVLLVGLLSGCVSSGRKIDQAAVETITKGETTKAQVITLLGSPDQITKLGSGDTIFMYNYMRAYAQAYYFYSHSWRICWWGKCAASKLHGNLWPRWIG